MRRVKPCGCHVTSIWLSHNVPITPKDDDATMCDAASRWAPFRSYIPARWEPKWWGAKGVVVAMVESITRDLVLSAPLSAYMEPGNAQISPVEERLQVNLSQWCCKINTTWSAQSFGWWLLRSKDEDGRIQICIYIYVLWLWFVKYGNVLVIIDIYG